MVVIYSIPSSSYKPGYEPEPTLDEVEISGPPTSFPSSPNSQKAKFKLNVKGSTLHAVKARIVMTRLQPIAGNPVPPSGGNWTYTPLPTGGAYEAVWELAGSASMAPNSTQDFSVDFTPSTAGTYLFTYSIAATEFLGTVETNQLVTIT